MKIVKMQECRVGEAAPALYYSAATHVKIDITGMQSHGARPYLGTSALDAACLVVQSANALRFNSNVVYNLKATQIHADAGVANAVPGTATITFDLRSRDNDVMELMIQKLVRLRIFAQCDESRFQFRFHFRIPEEVFSSRGDDWWNAGFFTKFGCNHFPDDFRDFRCDNGRRYPLQWGGRCGTPESRNTPQTCRTARF